MTNSEQQIHEQCAKKVNESAGQIVFVKGLFHYNEEGDAITWGLGRLRRILLPSDKDYNLYSFGYWDNTDQVILDDSVGSQDENKFLLCGRVDRRNYVAQIIDSKGTIIYEDKKSVDRWNNLFAKEINEYPFDCDYLSREGLEKILCMYCIEKKS